MEITVTALVAALLGLGTLVYVLALLLIERAPPVPLNGAHAFITGGSSGVGLATAIKLARHGAHVTIIARTQSTLDAAAKQIVAARAHSGVQVRGVSCDVSNEASVRGALESSESAIGPITLFIHSAGKSHPGYFEDIAVDTHLELFRLNYLGAVNCLRYLVPLMKSRGKPARIVLINSLAGLTGVFGFTAYSASKFALRGFAEALQMETAPYDIFVTVVNPPDIDTPGYAEENKIKPKECKLISENSGLFSADTIADSIIDSVRQWKFLVSSGFDGQSMTVIASGTSPASSAALVTVEFFAMGLLRFVSLFYRRYFNYLVHSVKNEKEEIKLRHRN